ncbi:hypothetical protein CW662_00275 [Macrococcoides caseolyticum]|uniref:phage scaffolding protein n=1 Tax=Macrococcoides caseolyticum TaxID=69966 RepID=UPI000C31C7B2|nr:phage scaffolding protein [Macrococcus caseolyticus]PKE70971.1 hypothetical protein CW662_00275 [Macrococcus caseolyticus]
MNREFLRGLGVTEDIIPNIINQHHDAMRPLKEKLDKADELQAQVDTLNAELTNRDTQLEQLQAKAKDNEELNVELEKYKQINADKDSEMQQLQLNNAIKVEAMKEGIVDADAFLKLVDTSKVKRNDDGTFDGLTELFTASKESMPYMYNVAKPTGITPPRGGQSQTMTKEKIMSISNAEERHKAIKENMHLFQ